MSKRVQLILLAPAAALVLVAISAPGAGSEAISLFNGKDLTNFYTFFDGAGKNNDPKKVFQVENGVIHVSGEQFGYLSTEKEYENYHLTVEYKWGERTCAPRKDKARDSGVLLHATGPDKVWPQCIECQMIEGGTCDIILVGTKAKPTQLKVTAERRDKQAWFSPNAPMIEFSNERINWWGRDPNWKDVAGVRGPKDVERPLGEWNRIEIYCSGPSINYWLNGARMNGGHNANLTRGRILLQSEGAEVFFRKVELRPDGAGK